MMCSYMVSSGIDTDKTPLTLSPTSGYQLFTTLTPHHQRYQSCDSSINIPFLQKVTVLLHKTLVSYACFSKFVFYSNLVYCIELIISVLYFVLSRYRLLCTIVFYDFNVIRHSSVGWERSPLGVRRL